MKRVWVLAAIGIPLAVATAQEVVPPTRDYVASEISLVVVTYAPGVADTVRIRGDGEISMSRGSVSRVGHMRTAEFDRVLRLALEASLETAKAEIDIRRGADGQLHVGMIEDTTRDCDSQVAVRMGSWRGDASCAPELMEALGAISALADWWEDLPKW